MDTKYLGNKHDAIGILARAVRAAVQWHLPPVQTDEGGTRVATADDCYVELFPQLKVNSACELESFYTVIVETHRPSFAAVYFNGDLAYTVRFDQGRELRDNFARDSRSRLMASPQDAVARYGASLDVPY